VCIRLNNKALVVDGLVFDWLRVLCLMEQRTVILM